MTEKRKSDFFESSSKRQSVITKQEEPPFPPVTVDRKYPPGYKENVKKEIEEWKLHLVKALDEKRQFRQRRRELKSKLLDETILSTEQLDFLGSISFNNYMKVAHNFCVKMAINNQQMLASDDAFETLEKLSKDIQDKIETEVFGRKK